MSDFSETFGQVSDRHEARRRPRVKRAAQREPEKATQLAKLVLELAEAVDNAAADIGGSRSQIVILREAVQIATSIAGESHG